MMDITGMTVVLTGAFSTFTRKEATVRLKEMGFNVSGSVSSRTEILFAGDRAGSKLTKAQQLGVTIMDEAALVEILDRKSVV